MKKVIGQTGKVVLSGEAIQYRIARKRTVRYQYTKLPGRRWIAWVCGPFHSTLYGVCGIGSKKTRAKAALQLRLANDYNYIGHMMYSDVDESDTVGRSPAEIEHELNNIQREETMSVAPRPISVCEAHGSAGM